MFSIVRLALVLFAIAHPGTRTEQEQVPELTPEIMDDEEKRFQDVALLSAIVHRSLDDDCNGLVQLEVVAAAFGMSPDEPRANARLSTFDPDQSGDVTPGELEAGIRAGVEEQVALTMLVDANDDGSLTLKEHALGFPDHEGEKNASGFTPRQVQGFEYLDRDGNARVSREEVVARHEVTFMVIYWAQAVAHHMERIDTDDDGLIRVQEFSQGLGYIPPAELPPAAKAWYDTVVNGDAPGISLEVFRVQLLQNRPVKSRLAMERPIRSLLVPTCWAPKP